MEELRRKVEGRERVRKWREERDEEEGDWEWGGGEWATRAFMTEVGNRCADTAAVKEDRKYSDSDRLGDVP